MTNKPIATLPIAMISVALAMHSAYDRYHCGYSGAALSCFNPADLHHELPEPKPGPWPTSLLTATSTSTTAGPFGAIMR